MISLEENKDENAYLVPKTLFKYPGVNGVGEPNERMKVV